MDNFFEIEENNSIFLVVQVYKSTGDLAEASKMYMKYSAVDNSDKDHPWAEWRDIVVDRKQPRKMMVQANTVIRGQI